MILLAATPVWLFGIFALLVGAAAAAAVVGEFANETKLSNGGEFLTLVAPGAGEIYSFRYGDHNGWPEGADGTGGGGGEGSYSREKRLL